MFDPSKKVLDPSLIRFLREKVREVSLLKSNEEREVTVAPDPNEILEWA